MKNFVLIAFAFMFAFAIFPDVGKCGPEKHHVVKMTVNIENERQLQKAVNDGHQPWRLAPADVAHAAVLSVNDKASYDNCHLIRQTDKEAWVKCTSQKEDYLVYLKRLVEPKGIWTAVSMEISPAAKPEPQ
ncbi:MAG: hypothetical protein HZB23_08915 [Deltaproteobacteria bacterium]|nr:hypothetical protein [Deltaproteobacteria bacterium]